MRKTAGYGCLGVITLTALAGYLGTQTEFGQWVLGLVAVYGGAIFAGAMAFSSHSGVITNLEAGESDFFNGFVEVEFVDASGEERSVRRQVIGSPHGFAELELGNSVTVLVCKSNPKVVEISGIQTFNHSECPLTKDESEDEEA